jgi:hypothetical protein
LEGVDLEVLARRYRFHGGQIRRAMRTALDLAQRDPQGLRGEVLERISRGMLPEALDRFSTQPPKSALGLEALILPPPAQEALDAFMSACKHRLWVQEAWGFSRRISTGRGVTALFNGEPGTGKTFAAGLLAKALDMPFYQINLAQIVDKYIGETEKHLEHIFQSAQAQQALLLFDEADALFARRVAQVHSSNDRHANIQTNHLLQQIEAFDGVCILTTNLENNMDVAFVRRIQFRVDFPRPDAPTRARIWRSLLPAEAPVEGLVDFEGLGEEFEMSGGHIRNALLRSAYRARQLGRGLSMELLREAAVAEYRATGRLLHSS